MTNGGGGKAHLIFKPIRYILSTLTHDTCPFDVRFLLIDTTWTDDFCIRIPLVERRDVDGVFVVWRDEVSVGRLEELDQT
jgi:hypothetical protein